MEVLSAVLPLAFFLACPLMMVFCTFAMRKKGSDAPAVETQAESQLPEARVAALQQQLQAIQAELTALQSAPVSPPALTRVSSSDRRADIDSGAAHGARHSA